MNTENTTTTEDTKPIRKRGFALLTPEQRSAISRKGALTAKANGTAHRWTRETAREAGRKGGRSTAKHTQRHDAE